MVALVRGVDVSLSRDSAATRLAVVGAAGGSFVPSPSVVVGAGEVSLTPMPPLPRWAVCRVSTGWTVALRDCPW